MPRCGRSSGTVASAVEGPGCGAALRADVGVLVTPCRDGGPGLSGYELGWVVRSEASGGGIPPFGG
jgi:hypothetical protein